METIINAFFGVFFTLVALFSIVAILTGHGYHVVSLIISVIMVITMFKETKRSYEANN